MVLEGSFLIFFAIFILTIKRSYISTFFTTMTAKQFACQAYHLEAYHLATTDRMRFRILKYHPSYHSSIKEELRVWLSSNWSAWTGADQPLWFTPRLLASIPADLLPAAATAETLEIRRKSIREEGGAQEGVRRFSVQLAGMGEGQG